MRFQPHKLAGDFPHMTRKQTVLLIIVDNKLEIYRYWKMSRLSAGPKVRKTYIGWERLVHNIFDMFPASKIRSLIPND